MALIALRRPADRRRDRGAREHRAPRADGQERARGRARRHQRDRPGGAGDHAVDRRRVPADRLHGRHRRQVLPRVRHHDRRRGADLDVRQLHARPDAVEHLARPAGRSRPRRVRPDAGARCTTARSAASPALFDRLDAAPVGAATRRILGWSLRHQLATLGIALATFVGSFFIIPLLGAEFVPKADFSETQVNFYTPVGSSLEVTETRARQVDAVLRELPEVRYTVTTINSGQAAGKIYAADLRAPGRPQGPRSAASTEMAVPLRERLARIPGITVTNIGLTDLGGGKSLQFSIQGTDLGELERLSKAITAKLRQIPGLVDLDTHAQARQADGRDRGPARRRVRRRPQRQHARQHPAHAGRRHDRRQLARARRRELRRQRAPRAGEPLRHRPTCSACRSTSPRAADGSPRVVRLSQVADVTPSTGPNQINRRDLNREINDRRQRLRPQLRRRLGRHPQGARRDRAGRPATATASAARPRT